MSTHARARPPARSDSGPISISSGVPSTLAAQVLASELHDTVAHHLSLVSLHASALEVTADAVMDGSMESGRAAAWVLERITELPLVYSSADPAIVAAAQQRYGREQVAAALEQVMGDTARRLADAGVSRLVSAGGETSGAVIEALDVAAMEFGPEIDPGVPALRVVGRELALALKSGNFGGEDFFERAAGVLGTT